MQDKVVLITGGNCGIGKATAIQLAQKGARVIISSRCPGKGNRAVASIRRQSQNDQVECIVCDLSSFGSIEKLARQVAERAEHLDVLINNAGLFCSHLQKTKEGFEMQFGVNYLGHFYLTQLLLPSLKASPEARVINVSSIAYMHGNIDFESFRGAQKYNGLQAYAQSKLANVLFTREFARRYPEIACNCLHPGVVRTSFGNKHSSWYLSLFWHFWKVFMQSPQKGAKTPVFLATAPEAAEVSGAFFDEKQQERNLVGHGRNDILAKRLWDHTKNLINQYSS